MKNVFQIEKKCFLTLIVLNYYKLVSFFIFLFKSITFIKKYKN